MTLILLFYHRFGLIKQRAPYIPALKCRALRRFFGKVRVCVLDCRYPSSVSCLVWDWPRRWSGQESEFASPAPWSKADRERLLGAIFETAGGMNCVCPNFQKDFPARGGWFLPGKVRQNHTGSPGPEKDQPLKRGTSPHVCHHDNMTTFLTPGRGRVAATGLCRQWSRSGASPPGRKTGTEKRYYQRSYSFPFNGAPPPPAHQPV
jgi:hypothetical protein